MRLLWNVTMPWRKLLLAALGSSAALALLPAVAQSQQNCSVTSRPKRVWPAPLDRIIAIRARDVALREGLDRVAAAARFRVSYSAEFLPLDKHVCLSTDSLSAGDALSELLAGVNVSPVAMSIDQVVIAPTSPTERTEAEAVPTLERVVVTGSAIGNAQRPLSVALDVVEGKKLARSASVSLASAFDGNVPGLWVWEQSPSTLLARYGSIRGASSFNVSYPKVYIDGIEAANPLLLTEMNPAILDRIEVIRGPQGAALYGADAISGVVNIITRHDGLQAGADRAEVVSGAGFSQTDYGARSVLAQRHSLNWRTGSSLQSATLAMSLTSLGEYVPQAHSRDLKLNGGFRAVTPTAAITGTARYYGKSAASGANPLLRGLEQTVDSVPQSVHQYTVGSTATLLTGGRWTPTFTVGVDGYRLANVPNDLAPVPSSLDSALHDARGGADRATFRAAFVGPFALASRESLTITLAAEHSMLRETVAGVDVGGGGITRRADLIAWRANSGLVAQGDLALRHAVYLTGGLRLERNDGFTLSDKAVLLPMVGVAAVRDLGRTTVKLRSAFGVGIRPAQTATREMALHDIRRFASQPALEPEKQSGTEVGADLLVGRRLGFHVTRFDQTATGLIQPVAIPANPESGSGTGSGGSGSSGPDKRLVYALQNVGEITNHGWEVESSLEFGVLSLGGALSTVNSIVQRIARSYTGDLRVGDRMLAVPARTASLSATWSQPQWFASATISRAFDWINYDRLKLANDYTNCSTCTAEYLSGNQLRSYWMRYDGVTRVRATFSRDLLRTLSLKLTGENLTNVQSGEPDNVTVLPGRTVMVGVSARIR